ncbi:hypothetical protein AAVH_41784, partial [Aphelenchoides avenae]
MGAPDENKENNVKEDDKGKSGDKLKELFEAVDKLRVLDETCDDRLLDLIETRRSVTQFTKESLKRKLDAEFKYLMNCSVERGTIPFEDTETLLLQVNEAIETRKQLEAKNAELKKRREE